MSCGYTGYVYGPIYSPESAESSPNAALLLLPLIAAVAFWRRYAR